MKRGPKPPGRLRATAWCNAQRALGRVPLFGWVPAHLRTSITDTAKRHHVHRLDVLEAVLETGLNALTPSQIAWFARRRQLSAGEPGFTARSHETKSG